MGGGRGYPAGTTIASVQRAKDVGDRQLDALLQRLDAIHAELRTLNQRLESRDDLQRISRELASLSESLQALAYAALGTQAPNVRRRRTG
jgi:DNA-binding FrmR family transcriptional regulator